MYMRLLLCVSFLDFLLSIAFWPGFALSFFSLSLSPFRFVMFSIDISFFRCRIVMFILSSYFFWGVCDLLGFCGDSYPLPHLFIWYVRARTSHIYLSFCQNKVYLATFRPKSVTRYLVYPKTSTMVPGTKHPSGAPLSADIITELCSETPRHTCFFLLCIAFNWSWPTWHKSERPYCVHCLFSPYASALPRFKFFCVNV